MTPEQTVLVQRAFGRALRFKAHVAATFFNELVAINPRIRAMFTGDINIQGQALISALGAIVDGLSQPESVLPHARELAIRHVALGVTPEHYNMFGLAVMRTLKHELGPDFTPEARDAWTAAYKFISDDMIAAANASQAA